jgi:myo-inositol 2-dehydrogenase / D-chiro-inositol 1-dehydrogenase
MPDKHTIAIGILGAGGMGQRHALNLTRYLGAAHVAAIYDPDIERARQSAAACGGEVSVFEDAGQLINSKQVEAVLVVSPDATHVDYVLECLRCRKPVLCEKPLATRPEEALKIIKAETELGQRLVSVGFMRRFDPQHSAVAQVARSGRLGRPILYKGVHRNTSIPYSVRGEVILTNSAGHDIDAARWLLEQEVEEVFVRGVRSRDTFSSETTDLLLIQMTLSNDCLASIEVFAAAEYGYEVSAEIVGEKGSAQTLQPDNVLLRHERTRSMPVAFDWLERFQDAYINEVREWVFSLREGRLFSGASAWDGYLALQVSAACVSSFLSGQPVQVDTPPCPALYRA